MKWRLTWRADNPARIVYRIITGDEEKLRFEARAIARRYDVRSWEVEQLDA